MNSQARFALTPSVSTPRSTFVRDHDIKTTFDEGDLIPIYVDEVLPGDTFKYRLTGFGRLATPIKPIMDNIYLDTFFFFVPSRLVWTNWVKMMGEQEDPGDSVDYVMPEVTAPVGGWQNTDIGGQFGIPRGYNQPVNAGPFRSYNLVWNEFFRDQNLQDSLTVSKTDGPDSPTLYAIRKRGKRHDYFTSCLPWPQKGPSIDIPLGSIAPVRPYPSDLVTGSQPSMRLNIADGNKPAVNFGLYAGSGTGHSYIASPGAPSGSGVYPSNLYADLTSASAATINQLRQAFQVQKLYEKDARGGTRYVELLKSHFGVTSPDFRHQRPEYLGGGSSMVNVNPIAQTSSTNTTTPQGNLSAMGTFAFDGHGFTKSFTEHGYIIGIACARADISYQQGLHKMWTRSTKLDFYWPSLAEIGEQAVLSREIYADGTSADDTVFGYQERFAEYRYMPSRISGKFRSSDPQPLDIWHLAQYFTSRPVLNADFIKENPPINRVVAVPSEPHFLFDGTVKLTCTRVMPMYGIPGNIDHL